jgi:hypothetical protein
MVNHHQAWRQMCCDHQGGATTGPVALCSPRKHEPVMPHTPLLLGSRLQTARTGATSLKPVVHVPLQVPPTFWLAQPLIQVAPAGALLILLSKHTAYSNGRDSMQSIEPLYT